MQSFIELNRLAKKAKNALSKGNPENLPIIKVAVVGDSATQQLSSALIGMAFSRGYLLNLFEADYNQIESLMIAPGGELRKFSPRYTILYQSTIRLLNYYSMADFQTRQTIATDRLTMINRLATACPEAGRLLVYNYPEIDDTIFGSFSNAVNSSFLYQVRKLNLLLADESIIDPRKIIIDLQAIQSAIGRNCFTDYRIYASTEFTLSAEALPLVASRTIDAILAREGRQKKCVVVDLDNTLWGGIVGDDGWENLTIGHHLGIGRSFTELQLWLKKLKERGIILAVCSKNDDKVAQMPFLNNPEMILHLEDFAIFMANWKNKADNILAISKTLNIGLDSIVFIDDNPAERHIVSQNLPEVTVPEIPDDPALRLEYLYSLNLFETDSFSPEEDKTRTMMYHQQAMRKEFSEQFVDEASYLQSLEMVATVDGLTPFNTPRIAQLSQRSNQFNLRTIRYTADELFAINSNKKDYRILAISLADRFGDNGLVATVILHRQEELSTDTWFIESWFMSCRVLNRGMEEFTIKTIVETVKSLGGKEIIGEYIPTQKNSLVSGLYSTFGFRPIENNPTKFILLTEEYTSGQCFITLQS